MFKVIKLQSFFYLVIGRKLPEDTRKRAITGESARRLTVSFTDTDVVNFIYCRIVLSLDIQEPKLQMMLHKRHFFFFSFCLQICHSLVTY
jgi:hypothetical protein